MVVHLQLVYGPRRKTQKQTSPVVTTSDAQTPHVWMKQTVMLKLFIKLFATVTQRIAFLSEFHFSLIQVSHSNPAQTSIHRRHKYVDG